jgi:hypothetical protein
MILSIFVILGCLEKLGDIFIIKKRKTRLPKKRKMNLLSKEDIYLKKKNSENIVKFYPIETTYP